jgi:hypothetical protein
LASITIIACIAAPCSPLSNTHGIAVTRDRRVIAAHTVHQECSSPDATCVFDETGRFIKSWGADLRGGAHGLVLREEGNTEFLSHCGNVQGFVRKTTLNGELVWVMHAPVASGLYSKASEYKRSILAIATIWPHAIAIDPRGKEPLLMPGLKAVVTLFNEENEPIAQLGGGRQPDGKTCEGLCTQGREAFPAGRFIGPHAACFDPDGNIFAAEWVEVGRITRLRKL